MTDRRYYQSRVSPYPDKNVELTLEQRMLNSEFDIVAQGEVLELLVAQNGKYTGYLDEEIKRKRESHLFWSEIRQRLATAGIIGVIGVLCTALWYAFTEWVKHQ